jgi:hypothetical protein
VINKTQEHEQKVFSNFVNAAKLNVIPDSIRPEEAPLPDISCHIDGHLHYFELTRVADQSIANEVGALLKETRRTGKGGVGHVTWYDDRQMLRKAITRKNDKKYETHGAPLDLLVYYDVTISPSPLPELIDSIFHSLQTEFHDQWNKIWLYDWSNNQVMFDSDRFINKPAR